MSTLTQMILCGMLVGTGAALLLREIVPAPPRLNAALERLSPPTPEEFASRMRTPAAEPSTQLGDRIGRYLESRLDRYTFLAAPRRDLALMDQDVPRFYTEKATAAAIGLAFPATLTILLPVIGLPVPPSLPMAAGLVLAGAMWFLPDAKVRAAATERREEFAYAAVAYVRLVAVNRRASKGLVESMEAAAKVSDSWMFQRINEELTIARWSRRTPWDALQSLGERLGVPQLRAIADIVRQAPNSDAGLTDNLMAHAASLRDDLNTTEHQRAIAAATRLTLPKTGLLGVLILLLGYPAAVVLLG